MLHGTATTDPKIRTTRLGAQRRFAQQFSHVGRFPLGLPAKGFEADPFTGQGTFDKNHFTGTAILVREMSHATRFHVEGLNVEQTVMHRFNREKQGLIKRLAGVILTLVHLGRCSQIDRAVFYPIDP